MTEQDVVPVRAEVTVEVLRPWDIVIVDVRTLAMVAGPFYDAEGARAVRNYLPEPGRMSIMTAGWLQHLRENPPRCGEAAEVPARAVPVRGYLTRDVA